MSTVHNTIEEMSREEAWELLTEAADRYLQTSADAFPRGWDAGEYAADDRPEVNRVAMLIPFVR